MIFGKTLLNEVKKWLKLIFIEFRFVVGIIANAVDPELTLIEFLNSNNLALIWEVEKSAGIPIEKVEYFSERKDKQNQLLSSLGAFIACIAKTVPPHRVNLSGLHLYNIILKKKISFSNINKSNQI